MKKIVDILSNVHADVDWESETGLIDNGLLDSFDVIALINDLNEAFGVEIDLEHLLPENFNSVQAIARLLQSLGASQGDA